MEFLRQHLFEVVSHAVMCTDEKKLSYIFEHISKALVLQKCEHICRIFAVFASNNVVTHTKFKLVYIINPHDLFHIYS